MIIYVYDYIYIWLYLYMIISIYDYTYDYIYICVTYIQMILTYLPIRIRGAISKLDCWKETNQSRMKSIFKEPQQTWLEHIYSTQEDSEKSCKHGSLIFPGFAFFYLLGLLYSWFYDEKHLVHLHFVRGPSTVDYRRVWCGILLWPGLFHPCTLEHLTMVNRTY